LLTLDLPHLQLGQLVLLLCALDCGHTTVLSQRVLNLNTLDSE
jgi:hypothetical protein